MNRRFNMHPAAAAIGDLLHRQEPTPALDSASLDEPEAGSSAADYAEADVALKAGAALQEWAETTPDDLGEGEGLADRLLGMMVGIADVNVDGELGDDEQAVLTMALESAWDYLASKDVPEDDINALLNDWSNDVASRVQELLAAKLPDGEEGAAADLDAFAFGDGGDEPALDAAYKMRVAVRKGKKVRIKKRVSGSVRLNAKQKMAVQKMLRKSHGAVAQMRRAKSMRVRRKSGL